VREAASAAGRPLPRIACGLPVAVGSDLARGREAVRALITQSARLPAYRAVLEREGVPAPEDVALVGDAAALRERILELAELGVSDFHAIPVPSGDGDRGLAPLLELLADLARAQPSAREP
jgi:alkanesulfonate monooxygenase SsuD/methylene tetrahydromethanopterin reductase-like flavin-dependent oxidoreductase (luciferase family)